jgi:nucleoside-diphosphate-sugar epimerase
VEILVTGAAGFIGSHVAIELASRGHNVTAADMFLDRLYPNEQKIRNWDLLAKVPSVRRVVVDLRGDLSKLDTKFDVIVNEAGMPGLMTSWTEFDSYLSCNIKLVENLISNLNHKDLHLVQISTSSVYGIEAKGSEDSELQPTSPYGVSKLAAEELVRTYARTQGLNYTILRYFSVFGPGQRPDMAYNRIINAISTGKPVTIYGDGNQTRTNTYVGDISKITSDVAEAGGYNDVFNISGRDQVRLLDAVSIIEEIIGTKATINFQDKRPGDQLATSGVISKATEILGYNPGTSFVDGITRQIKWQLDL